MDWTDLVQGTDRWCNVLYMMMKFWFPQNAGSFLNSWGTISFSKRTMLHAVSLLWAYTHLKVISKTHYSHTREKVTQDWKLKMLHALYSWQNTDWLNQGYSNERGTWQKKNAYRVIVGKPEGKRTLWRTGHRWENYIEVPCSLVLNNMKQMAFLPTWNARFLASVVQPPSRPFKHLLCVCARVCVLARARPCACVPDHGPLPLRPYNHLNLALTHQDNLTNSL